jgi:hypothetical protein
MENRSKISVVLSVEEFRRFDAYCAEKGFKKSTLIARLIREHMDREGFRVQGTLFDTEPPRSASKGSSRPRKRTRGRAS